MQYQQHSCGARLPRTSALVPGEERPVSGVEARVSGSEEKGWFLVRYS